MTDKFNNMEEQNMAKQDIEWQNMEEQNMEEQKVEHFDSNIVYELYEKINKTAFEEREEEEDSDTTSEWRTAYSHDYARILYSSSFRRLQGKMQILGVESTAFYRDRLTHSLEVSQIARSIARFVAYKCGKQDEMYKENELFLLDAAALAHDIGHPAFGHKGERVLDEIAILYKQRFEGNAQNFRVLRKLDRHNLFNKGLNLTYRTLLAINKYNEDEDDRKKKFMYHDDYEFLNKCRNKNNLGEERTLDVQIIELADDIAYAVHDLEDGLSQGMFTIDEIFYGIRTFEDENSEINEQINNIAFGELQKIVNSIKEELEEKSDEKKEINITTTQAYSHLFRKRLTSKLTGSFIRSITTGNKGGKTELCLGSAQHALCKILAKTIFRAATKKQSIALYELKGEIILKSLFNIYANIKINKDYMLLPPDYRPTQEADLVRCVLDYLAGMMDTYAISEYERFTGIKFDKIDVTKIPDIYEFATINKKA